MVSSSPESNYFESHYEKKHYFSREQVDINEWVEDNEERLNYLFSHINEYSRESAVKIMDKCTFEDFCGFMFYKSTAYERNLRYMYTST